MKATLIVEGKEFPIEINDPELQKIIAPPKKTGYELVGNGHTYSFVSSYGEVKTLDHQDQDDMNRFVDANYYSNCTVAENNARADRLMRQLRRFAVENRANDIDWGNAVTPKWFICYEYEKLSFDFDQTFRTYNTIYFDSQELVERAIEVFHDELIWYFTEYKDSL